MNILSYYVYSVRNEGWLFFGHGEYCFWTPRLHDAFKFPTVEAALAAVAQGGGDYVLARVAHHLRGA